MQRAVVEQKQKQQEAILQKRAEYLEKTKKLLETVEVPTEEKRGRKSKVMCNINVLSIS